MGFGSQEHFLLFRSTLSELQTSTLDDMVADYEAAARTFFGDEKEEPPVGALKEFNQAFKDRWMRMLQASSELGDILELESEKASRRLEVD